MGLFSKLKEGLKKTRETLFDQIDSMLKIFKKVDEELFEELEELLVMGDVGIKTSQEICEKLKEKIKNEAIKEPRLIKEALCQIIQDLLKDEAPILEETNKPTIILVIGVNGVGKTTTIGKLALKFKKEGKKIILGAADTFRAAAVQQLEIWANRAQVEIIKQNEGTDPGAVVFDTINAAKSRKSDIIICDTAGRLHNKKHLMEELGKINRIITRELPESTKEFWLVLDATTGQNALNQAKEFKNTVGLTGIILTKLDGTAKGGVILAIKNELNVPIKFIGIGEQIEDLQEFNSKEFTNALFEN